MELLQADEVYYSGCQLRHQDNVDLNTGSSTEQLCGLEHITGYR